MNALLPPKDLIGHRELWSFLIKAREKGNLGHTLIFFGPEGVGKETFARFFVTSFLCEKGPEICGVCVHCRMVREKRHPQVRELLREIGTLPIEEIRVLQKNLRLRRDHVKEPQFVLLKDIRNLSLGAINALLKILEEPPESFYCIGITREIKNVLPTLRSRAQLLYFSLVGEKIIGDFFRNFFDSQKLVERVNFARGRPGIAKQIIENPKFFEEQMQKYKQVFREIEEAHIQGRLREKKMTQEELLQMLPFVEQIGRRLYRAKITREDSSIEAQFARGLSQKELQVFLLRILKSYSLLEKNISPLMILDQLYSNI